MLHKLTAFILLIITVLIISCNKEDFLNSPNYSLKYSLDTIKFDTVFSEKGTITRTFKILNPHKGKILINQISLINQSNLEYFINVNGISARTIQDIEINSGDSLFVFIQAKLKSNSVDTAILHEDKIRISYNSKYDDIIVQTWGQNVHFLKGNVISTTNFTNQIPYVIYDSLVVKQGETLTIQEGTKLYFHYNANLIVRGSLVIQGSLEKPVIFTSDRLESSYQMLPGQWGSIIFENTSNAHVIEYATIKNGTNGCIIRGNNTNRIPITIANSKIYNMSSNIIYAKNADILIYNSVFANSNNYILALQGGKCTCIHSTISNEGTIGGRNIESSIYITDYDFADESKIECDSMKFYNSIIYGQITNEISISAKHSDSPLLCKFDYCLLKDTYVSSEASYYGTNQYYKSDKNLFVNSANYDFRLDTLSQAANIGKLAYAQMYSNDFLNHQRTSDSKPDVGAFEYFIINEE